MLTRRLTAPWRPREQAKPLSDSDLFGRFESIGDNCEFGTIQRSCGAEPFSLFRFTFSMIENLINVLETDAVDFFTEDDLEIFHWPNHDEHIFRSRHYQDFGYHTYRSSQEISADAMKSEEIKKIAYLKRGFMDDLRSGEKVYVRKGRESLEAVERLHEALNRHGPNSLLWVVPATETSPAGSLEVLGDGLYRGSIARFKDFAKDEPSDLESWVAVCRQAYAKHSMLRSTQMRPRPSPVTFVGNALVQSGSGWTAGPACKKDVVDDRPRGVDPARVRLTLQRDTSTEEVIASQDVAIDGVKPRSIIVFAAWIWIPGDFDGYRLDAWFQNIPSLFCHGADLTKRDSWQKVWTNAKLPRGVTSVAVSIRAGGSSGSSVLLSAWSLEQGTIPSQKMPKSPRGMPSHSTTHADARSILRSPRLALTALLAPGDLDSRIRHFKRGGGIWRSYRQTVETLLANGRYEDADAILMQALGAFPNDLTFLKLHARSADESGRTAAAVVRWQAALKETPRDPACLTRCAASFRRHGLAEAAADVIARALRDHPSNGAILAEAGLIAEARSRNDEALASYEKAVALDEVEADWLHGHALALARVGRLAEARKATEIAVAAHPKHRNLVALQRHFSTTDRQSQLAPRPT